MIRRQKAHITGPLLFAGIIGLGLVLLSACNSTPNQAVAAAPVESIETDTIVPEKDAYGIALDLYAREEGEVRRNQTLSDLLHPYGLSMQEIYHISLLPDSLIDERKIKQGNPYLFYSLKDSDSDLPLHSENIFIYEKDALNFVAVYINPDSIWARNGRKPVDTKLQLASGTIETSLWESMLAADANPMLAVELSEIFAWTIDFFGIQQGDRYKVMY